MSDPVETCLASWLKMLVLAEAGDRPGFKKELANQVQLYKRLRDQQGEFHHRLALWYEAQFQAATIGNIIWN